MEKFKIVDYVSPIKEYFIYVGLWPNGTRYETTMGLWPSSVRFYYRIRVRLK